MKIRAQILAVAILVLLLAVADLWAAAGGTDSEELDCLALTLYSKAREGGRDAI